MEALHFTQAASFTDMDNIFKDQTYQDEENEVTSVSDIDTDSFYSAADYLQDHHQQQVQEQSQQQVQEHPQQQVQEHPQQQEIISSVNNQEQPQRQGSNRFTRNNNPQYVFPDPDEEEVACVATIQDVIKIHGFSTAENFLAFGVFEVGFIPQTNKQAEECKEAPFWRQAKSNELQSLLEKKTFGKAHHTPRGRKAVKSRWVFAKKFDENNNLVKFKARLVAKGFSQVYGEDYVETFSPVALLQSIRTLTAIAAAKGYKIHHMDVGYSRGYFAGIT